MTSTIFGHTEIILEENRKAKDLKPASGWKMRMETHWNHWAWWSGGNWNRQLVDGQKHRCKRHHIRTCVRTYTYLNLCFACTYIHIYIHIIIHIHPYIHINTQRGHVKPMRLCVHSDSCKYQAWRPLRQWNFCCFLLTWHGDHQDWEGKRTNK